MRCEPKITDSSVPRTGYRAERGEEEGVGSANNDIDDERKDGKKDEFVSSGKEGECCVLYRLHGRHCPRKKSRKGGEVVVEERGRGQPRNERSSFGLLYEY